MLIVGERINSSRKSIARAVECRDKSFIRNEAEIQVGAGADFIDVNAGSLAGDEIEHLKWIIEIVQAATDAPLCIDSPSPAVIRAVLPVVQKPLMINSITLEPTRLEGMLPLVVEYKAKVIGLCQSENGMAEATEAKVEMAGRLVEKATHAGVALDDIYIDPLVFPLATSTASASNTLAAIDQIVKKFPGIHTICGLTNISYGLPKRKLINRAFLVAAVARGLDAAIIDPTDAQLYGSILATLPMVGQDDFCRNYLKAYRAGRLE
jgi:5-methyltetrahydrofolate--homocysteine methyltransferase